MGENFGQTVRHAEYAGGRVSERLHTDRPHLREHAHESLQVCLVLEGELIEEFGGIPLEGAPGTVIVRPAMALHRDTFGTAYVRTLLVEYFRGPRFDSLFTARREARVLPAGMCAALVRQIGRELRAADLASPAALEGMVLQLAARMIRASSEPEMALVAAARQRIERAFPHRVDAGALAAELQMSRSRLFETFHRLEGKTIGAYIGELRLERARELLAGTPASLSDVAAACGFADQSHFTRAFHADMGETPAQFRRRTRV